MTPQRYSNLTVFFLVLLLSPFSGTIGAQSESASGAGTQQEEKVRTVIKNVSFVDAQVFEDVLSILPLTVVIKQDIDAIVLRGASAPLETALAIIDSMDVPAPPNPMIELRGYILAVSRDKQEGQIPENLKQVTEELRDLFGFTSYRLVDTVFLRSNGSRSGVGGSARMEDKNIAVSYQLGFNRGQIMNFDRSRQTSDSDAKKSDAKKNRHVIRFNGLALMAGETAVISTDIEIFEGQTAVIGKARLDDALGDLILVIEAKVLDGGLS